MLWTDHSGQGGASVREWLIRHKKIAVAVAAVIGIAAGAWQLLSVRVVQTMQQSLTQQAGQQLNGRLETGTVDLSLTGWVRIHDVALYDSKGALLAQSPAVRVQYSFSDLTGGVLGMPQIEAVVLEGAQIWLREENNRLNWEGLLKEEQTADGSFRGEIRIEGGKIHAEAALMPQVIEAVNGSLQFKSYPDLDGKISGKINQSPVDVSGRWKGSGPGELSIETGEIDLAAISGSVAGKQDGGLIAGKLKQMKISAQRDEHGKIRYRMEGEFDGLKSEGSPKISEGRGRFNGDESGIQLTGLSLFYDGQPAQGEGKVAWQNGNNAVDISLSLPDVDPAAFISGLTVQRPLALRVQITGPLEEPKVSGSFTMPQLQLSDMVVSQVSGEFQYMGGQMLLQHAQGSAYQGMLEVQGNIGTDSQSYELDISGYGMDSSRLSDKDVNGPLDFTGHISGQGQGAVTRGQFVIRDGKAYGIAFRAMTGTFIKRGTSTEVSDLAVETAFGTFYPEQLTQEALERIHSKNLPVSQDELKRNITEKVIQRILR
jgi:hypothetical protein